MNVNKRLDAVKESLESIQYKQAQTELNDIEDILDKIDNAITIEIKLPKRYLHKKINDEETIDEGQRIVES